MDKEREEIMEMLSKNNMNISSQNWLCDKETDVPVWEFSTILYKETYDERVSDEIEAKEVSEIGGWCVPTTKNYTVESLLTTCDDIGGDLETAYHDTISGAEFDFHYPVVVINKIECEASDLDMVLDMFPLISGSFPCDACHVCCILSVKDEGIKAMRFNGHGWKTKKTSKGIWTATKFQD